MRISLSQLAPDLLLGCWLVPAGGTRSQGQKGQGKMEEEATADRQIHPSITVKLTVIELVVVSGRLPTYLWLFIFLLFISTSAAFPKSYRRKFTPIHTHGPLMVLIFILGIISNDFHHFHVLFWDPICNANLHCSLFFTQSIVTVILLPMGKMRTQ